MMTTIVTIVAACVLFAVLVAFAAIWLGSKVDEDTERVRAKAAAQMAVTDGDEEAVA